MPFAVTLERPDEGPLHPRHRFVERLDAGLAADVEDMHVQHAAAMVDLQHHRARHQVHIVDGQREHHVGLDGHAHPHHRAQRRFARADRGPRDLCARHAEIDHEPGDDLQQHERVQPALDRHAGQRQQDHDRQRHPDTAEHVRPRDGAPQQHPHRRQPGDRPQPDRDLAGVAAEPFGQPDLAVQPHPEPEDGPRDHQERQPPHIDQRRPDRSLLGHRIPFCQRRTQLLPLRRPARIGRHLPAH